MLDNLRISKFVVEVVVLGNEELSIELSENVGHRGRRRWSVSSSKNLGKL